MVITTSHFFPRHNYLCNILDVLSVFSKSNKKGISLKRALTSEKCMRRAVYHNVYVSQIFLKNKDLRPIHLMDCVRMVQYHNLWSLTSNFEYFGYTRPWKCGPNLILSVRPFPKMAAFQCGRFHDCIGGWFILA